MISVVRLSAFAVLIHLITATGQVYDHLDRGLDAIDEGEVMLM
jgi:hypothetical protein